MSERSRSPFCSMYRMQLHVPCVCRRILYIIDANVCIALLWPHFPRNQAFSFFSLSIITMTVFVCVCESVYVLQFTPPYAFPLGRISVLLRPCFAFAVCLNRYIIRRHSLHFPIARIVQWRFSPHFAFIQTIQRHPTPPPKCFATHIRHASHWFLRERIALCLSTYRRTHAAFRENWRENVKEKKETNEQTVATTAAMHMQSELGKFVWQSAHDAYTRHNTTQYPPLHRYIVIYIIYCYPYCIRRYTRKTFIWKF